MELVKLRGKYVKIDKNCIDLVNYFNDEVGLETKYCCEGHSEDENFYIMFSDSTNDVDIVNFIEKYSTIHNHSPFLGKFCKWCRKMSGKISYNWAYVATSSERARVDYQRMLSDEFKVK